jgi:hypothetical protein
MFFTDRLTKLLFVYFFDLVYEEEKYFKEQYLL